MGSATYEGFHAFSAHANLVTVSTGKRSNFIFDADLVAGAIPFSFNKTTATSYELRNYDGDVLKSGSLAAGAPPTITDADLTWRGRGPYGWYRLYLFGTSVANWGTAYGDCTFYRVSDSDLFPDNPSSATTATGTNGIDEIARGVMGMGPPRVNASLAAIYPWDHTFRATATGTAITLTPGALGGSLAVLIFHSFVGDASELATPTNSGTAFTVLGMESRATTGNVTATVWHARWSGVVNPGTITISSGTKSGTHQLYMVVIQGGWWTAPNTRTPVTTTGTGTSASVVCPVQGFTSGGPQKAIFGFVATSEGVTFAPWSSGMSTTAWDLSVPGDWPAAPASMISVASDVISTDVAKTITATWDTSREYAMIGISVRALAAASGPTSSVALTKTWWANYATPNRPRKPIVLFADGINQRTSLVAGLNASYGDNVAYSPFNEPIYSRSVADYINYDLAPFYTAAKAADATCTVLGGSPVSFNTAGIGWITNFVAAGGLDYLDDFDFHPYNCFNGDIAMSRATLQSLIDLLDANGFTGNLWQTEQGFAWLFMGQTMPRYSGRWTALMYMMCELYGIPVERNFYWYDLSHGFEAFPTYWTGSNGPGPQGLLVRTMVAELGDRTLNAQLDFGDASNLYAGGTWVGTDGSKTVGFMAQSAGQPAVRFYAPAASYVVVDCWGNESTVVPIRRVATLEASEMPTWIRVPTGGTFQLIPEDWDWGTNHAAGATPTASFTGAVSISRVTDGFFNNQYTNSTSSLTNASAPFNDTASTPTFPATVTVPFGSTKQVGRIMVACPPPWQVLTTFMDFDLEYQNADDTWTVAESFEPDAATAFYFTSVGKCRAETFWSQRHIFVWETTTPVQAKAVRCTVRQISDGPHESSVWTNNGQITLTPKVMVSEIQVWSGAAATPITDSRERFNLTVTCSG